MYNNNAVEPVQIEEPFEEDSDSEEDFYIVNNPTLDLEAYANNYTGLAKLYRLIYIADHCPTLRFEAIKMAILYVMETYNINLYQELHKKLQLHYGGIYSPDVGDALFVPPLDSDWVYTKTTEADIKLQKLLSDLKTSKGNCVRDLIRSGYVDVGNHYLDCGDLYTSLNYYLAAIDSTTEKHMVNMCHNVIKVKVYLKNWADVLNFVNMATISHEVSYYQCDKSDDELVTAKLKCASGLAKLEIKKYKEAAQDFLQSNFDHPNQPEYLSANDIGVYGGLCALATFDRSDLQKYVMNNRSFKIFLELEPQLRDILFQFYDSKFDTCLKLLDDIKENLYLDMYIAPHVNTLYTKIRKRAIIQYFRPYQSADMERMAETLNTSVSALEDELIQLILDGHIHARIDSHNKILYANDMEQRRSTFEKIIRMGKDYQRDARMLILRAALLKAHISVKPLREERVKKQMKRPLQSQVEDSEN